MTMTDDSLLKTGNTSGGQSGLRYNPRETAGDEVGYGVSHTKYNPRDPDEKQKDEEEKDKQKEKRAHAKAGLQHIKVKVKNKKREEEEARKKEAEISELTGPAASRGGDLDNAIGTKTGTGSAMGGGVDGMPPELPIAGAFGQGGAFVRAFDVLKDAADIGTETIDTVRAKQRGEKARRTMRDSGRERKTRRGKGGRPLRIGWRDPKDRPVKATQRVATNPQQSTQGQRITSPQYKGGGGRRPSQAKDQRVLAHERERREISTTAPKSDIVSPSTTPTGFEHRTPGVKLVNRPRRRTSLKPRKPATAAIPGGAGNTPKIGQATPFAKSVTADVLEIGNLLAKRRDFNQSQIFEIRQLLRDAKKLLDNLTKKSYMPGQGDDAEGPSPNASRKQTSHNTGATEVDDDWGSPLEWGNHAYGLLVGRRGQP